MPIRPVKRIINGEERDCYIYDIYLGGRRVRTPRGQYFPTIGECRAAIDAIRTDYRRGLYKFPADEVKVSIYELADKASDTLKAEGKAHGYALRMKRSLRILAKVVPVTVSVRDLKTEHLEEFIWHEIRAGIKHSTIRNKVNTLIVGLNMAPSLFKSLREWTPPKRPRKMLEPDGNRTRVITEDEEAKIIEAFKAPSIRKSPFIDQMRIQNARIFWLALRTGLRSGEILGLEKADINFSPSTEMPNGYIYVQRTAGKKTTKTKKPRVVPMIQPVAEAMKKWLKESKSTHVFSSPYRTQSPVTIFRIAFREAVKRAGLPYGRDTKNGIIFHDARHTAATRLLNAGATVRDVADILGHSDTYMTMRYVHSTPGTKQKAMELLNDGSSSPV